MEYQNPSYTRNNEEINCEVKHAKYGWIPFTARPDDGEEFGRELYAQILADAEEGAITIAAYTGESSEELELRVFRETATVSAFQAHQALDDFGYIEQVETIIADPATLPKTRRAWQMATEFRRLSPTVLEIAAALELTDEQIDELFVHALSIEA